MNWKKIDGYENYSVSDEGEIRNDKTGRILKQCSARTGYSRVTLSKNGNIKTFHVHRLVMNAFCPCPDKSKYTDVNHIDYNKSNNALSNLEWTTHSANMLWGSMPASIDKIGDEIKTAVINILLKYISEQKTENISEKLKNITNNSLVYYQRNNNQ